MEEDLGRATGSGDVQKEDTISNLSRVVQLTGFSDPVYAEAIVKIQGFDILLGTRLVMKQRAFLILYFARRRPDRQSDATDTAESVHRVRDVG